MNAKDNIARRDLVDAYRQKYSEHSRLEEVLKISCLAQNWRPITEALESFDKHISLDKGKFVYHRNWGVGRVRSITEDEVLIDFAKQRGHKMALDMATTSLMGLDKHHIWVLKATMPKEKLRAKIKSEMIWALTILAGSNGGRTDFKRIKAELVPSLFTQSEWSTWSNEARRLTKTVDILGTTAVKLTPIPYAIPQSALRRKSGIALRVRKISLKSLPSLSNLLKSATPKVSICRRCTSTFTRMYVAMRTSISIPL